MFLVLSEMAGFFFIKIFYIFVWYIKKVLYFSIIIKNINKMKNITLEQVFEILDKKFELAFARENTIVMEVITDIKDQLLDIVEN